MVSLVAILEQFAKFTMPNVSWYFSPLTTGVELQRQTSTLEQGCKMFCQFY